MLNAYTYIETNVNYTCSIIYYLDEMTYSLRSILTASDLSRHTCFEAYKSIFSSSVKVWKLKNNFQFTGLVQKMTQIDK
jgi:hypothetical protein